jgi:predicted glycogen debranching enzyme
VLVNGFEAWADTPAGTFALSTARYAPDVLYPDGAQRIASCVAEPWPTWTFELPDGTRLTQEILVRHGEGTTLVVWRVASGAGPVVLRVRPMLSGRDYHSMHHENSAFQFDAEITGASIAYQPYRGLPRVVFLTNGTYRHAPEWYRQFLYRDERERGLDDTEDLASPGEIVWTTAAAGPPAIWLMRAGAAGEEVVPIDVESMAARLMREERSRRSAFGSPIDRAADAYLVRRGAGRTIVAGYPWFTDWGRDTFIAIRGLCLATGRLAEARDILVEWAGSVSEGMLPNRFPDSGETPEFNSVDASLWYVIAVHEFLEQAKSQPRLVDRARRAALELAATQIVDGYAAGTRFGIRMDADGLLAAGVPGFQLTWMDARVGDHVITPRIGKPVEIQALWLNALWIVSQFTGRWRGAAESARATFVERFWNEEAGRLADVVDVDHVQGTRDMTFRPNQILAIGGLPIGLIDHDRGRRVVDAVEQQLLTPIGLRSLAPTEPGYARRYEGNGGQRDAVYHQGTVWPWLLGPFVEAWVRVHGGTEAARAEARRRFLPGLSAHLDGAGLGHVSEIADAEAPFVPRGCPFQAWSLGELIRLDRVVLGARVERVTMCR